MVTRKHSAICPRCGSIETIPIRAGRPEPDPGKKGPTVGGSPLERMLGIDNPNRVCKKCGHQWQTRPKR